MKTIVRITSGENTVPHLAPHAGEGEGAMGWEWAMVMFLEITLITVFVLNRLHELKFACVLGFLITDGYGSNRGPLQESLQSTLTQSMRVVLQKFGPPSQWTSGFSLQAHEFH